MEFLAIVEDHKEYRLALHSVLVEQGFQIAGSFTNVMDAMECSPKPALILLDIGLPKISGIEGAPMLKKQFPGVRILMLTNLMDDDSVFDALQAGADGYLLKNILPVRLKDAIHETLAGGASMSPGIARRVLDVFKAQKPAPKNDYALSDRELEILKLLVRGRNGRQAADELFISFETARTHVRNIYEKLHVNSRAEVVAKAMSEKLV